MVFGFRNERNVISRNYIVGKISTFFFCGNWITKQYAHSNVISPPMLSKKKNKIQVKHNVIIM